jgi:uncharacterized coiled-coil DUF342 family protein
MAFLVLSVGYLSTPLYAGPGEPTLESQIEQHCYEIVKDMNNEVSFRKIIELSTASGLSPHVRIKLHLIEDLRGVICKTKGKSEYLLSKLKTIRDDLLSVDVPMETIQQELKIIENEFSHSVSAENRKQLSDYFDTKEPLDIVIELLNQQKRQNLKELLMIQRQYNRLIAMNYEEMNRRRRNIAPIQNARAYQPVAYPKTNQMIAVSMKQPCEDDCFELEEKIVQLIRANQVLEDRLNEYQMAHMGMNTEWKEVLNMNDDLAEELSEAIMKYEEALDENERLVQRLEEKEWELDQSNLESNEIEDLRKRLAAAHSELKKSDTLKQNIQLADEKASQLEKQVQSLKDQLTDKQMQLSAEVEQNKALQLQYSDLNLRQDALKSQFQEKIRALAESEKQLDDQDEIMSQLDYMKAKIGDKDEIIESLRSEIRSVYDDIGEYEKKLGRMQGKDFKIENLENELV